MNGGPVAPELDPAGGIEDQLANLAAERDGYLDQLQRSLADFANYRRRVEQERAVAREVATRGILAQILPILDDFQRALDVVPANERDTAWVQGVQMIEKKLQALLEREGVTAVDSLGQPFDPSMHEAVATEEGSTHNIIVEVYQQGYKHGQNLLRPAMVKVGDRRN